ncbi:hypothetical protein OG455_09615 [Kitasatospora sp. NBC_01287]|uniref:hypothetical protein n=1 Tax=Kitasatospora sp. NBC_01287 TaxID=2903573 RepID=UPI0022581422|nr:hypothetical protein [Kitasatospora sp. NBC_01287]MCX4745777.1 hypothetical protein [Kitasatospora sp. NBC_01287]
MSWSTLRATAPSARSAVSALSVRWAPRVLVLASAAMLPWLLYLGLSLPGTVTAPHWRAAWLGLDLAGLATLAAACLLACRRDDRARPLAITHATLVAAGLWFGRSTAAAGPAPGLPLLADGGRLSLAALCLLFAAARAAPGPPAPPVRPPTRPTVHSHPGETTS